MTLILILLAALSCAPVQADCRQTDTAVSSQQFTPRQNFTPRPKPYCPVPDRQNSDQIS
jgi:hypothetical protein